MKVSPNGAKQKRLKAERLELQTNKDKIKAKLAEKFGDKFKPVKKGDSTVVISKEAHEKAEKAKAEKAIEGDIKSNDPNSEETKEKLRGLLMSGTFAFNDKERDALNEILG